MHENIERVLVSEEELHQINARLGAQITADYAGKNLLVVGILKGSVLFMADLIREIQLPCKLDFLAVSSYGGDTTGYQIPFNVHYTGVKTKGTFNPATKAFTEG